MNEYYVSFEEILNEVREWYNDLSKTKELLANKKPSYLEGRMKVLEQSLELSLKLEEELKYLGDWDPQYMLLGHFFEGFMQTILMKEEKTEKFFETCYDKKRKQLKSLGALKQLLLTNPKILALSDEQQERISHVLTYVQLQRNKVVHFHPKMIDYSDIEYEIYLVILKFSELFGLSFSQEMVEKLEKEIEEMKKYPGLKFKDVWNLKEEE